MTIERRSFSNKKKTCATLTIFDGSKRSVKVNMKQMYRDCYLKK